jgi:hypothetical protein
MSGQVVRAGAFERCGYKPRAVTFEGGEVENRNQSAATSEGGSDRVRQNKSAEVSARLDGEMRERVEACAARGEGGAAGAARALGAAET